MLLLIGNYLCRISRMEEQEELLGGNGVGIRVSTFDYSVENHFKEMDMISKLCGEAQTDSVDEIEIQCYKSSITFLRSVIFSVYKLHVDGLLLFLCLCIIFYFYAHLVSGSFISTTRE